MDRIALRRAQRALRRPRHVSSMITGIVVAIGAGLTLPSVALTYALPIGLACAAVLVFVALPLGPTGTAASLRHEPTLPE